MTQRESIFQRPGRRTVSRGILAAAVAVGLGAPMAMAQNNQGAPGQPGQQQGGQQQQQQQQQQRSQHQLSPEQFQQALQQAPSIRLQQGKVPHVAVMFPTQQQEGTRGMTNRGGGASAAMGAGAGRGGTAMQAEGQHVEDRAAAAAGIQFVFITEGGAQQQQQPGQQQQQQGQDPGQQGQDAGIGGQNQPTDPMQNAVVVGSQQASNGVASFKMDTQDATALKVVCLVNGQPVQVRQVVNQGDIIVLQVAGQAGGRMAGGPGAGAGEQAPGGDQPEPQAAAGQLGAQQTQDAIVLIYLSEPTSLGDTPPRTGQGQRPGQDNQQPGGQQQGGGMGGGQ